MGLYGYYSPAVHPPVIDDFLLPEDSPLYEGNLEDSQEIMQLLSGMEAEGSTVRTSARIKSKRSSSSIFNGDDDDESYGSNEGGIQKKKKLSKSTGSSNKPVTDQQRIERRWVGRIRPI